MNPLGLIEYVSSLFEWYQIFSVQSFTQKFEKTSFSQVPYVCFFKPLSNVTVPGHGGELNQGCAGLNLDQKLAITARPLKSIS